MMRGTDRGPDDARPVTEDAMQRTILTGGVGSPDAVRRRIVRHDHGADRVVAIVRVRQCRPDDERDEREQRGCANRPCPGAEPLQHQASRLTSGLWRVKATWAP